MTDDTPAGVRLPRTVFVLRFDDGDLAGQVVRARSTSAGGEVDIAMAGERPPTDTVLTGSEQADRVYRLFRAFARSLLSWTLLDDETGDPVPATFEGLLSLDFGHATHITYAWLDAVGAAAHADEDRAATEAELQLPVEALTGVALG